MDSDKLHKIQAHVREIAALLYEEAAPEQLSTLEGIESVVREQILEYISPQIGLFLSRQQAGSPVDAGDSSKVSWGSSASAKAKRSSWKSKAVPN
jgi:hypothetical protein